MNLTSTQARVRSRCTPIADCTKKKRREIPTGKRCTSAVDPNGCCICNQRPISERAKFESLISRSDTSSLFQKDDSNLFPPSRYRCRTDCMYRLLIRIFDKDAVVVNYGAVAGSPFRRRLASSLSVTTPRRVRLSLRISK